MSSSKKYTPPTDFVLQTGSTAPGFDSETLEDKELWLLRIPDNVSTKKLEGLKIKHPKIAHKGVLGQTTIGISTYELISSESNVPAEFKGMAEMSVLVPDTDNDDMLTLLPNNCSQLLSLVEKFELSDSTEYANHIATRDHPARPQPENMKMQFIPYGFYSAKEYDDMKVGGSQDIVLPSQFSEALASSGPSLKKRKTDEPKIWSKSVNQDPEMDIDEAMEKKKKKSKDKAEKKIKKEKKHKKSSEN
ncbi:hypothetical protein LPJ74_004691 [Coemansia sp. RSA 1843]|nr:hypothetical protein LPJ74_004691 [Coemansia sp. RSA 1843]